MPIAAEQPLVGFPFRRVAAAPLTNRLSGGKKLGRERKTLQRHRERRQIQILAAVLKFAAVDDAEFHRLFERDQIGMSRTS